MLAEADSKTLAEMWEVRMHQSAPERAGKVALVASMRQPLIRKCAEMAVDFAHEHLELVRIDEGAEQVVYRRGNRAIKELKHNHRHAGMNPDDIAEMLQRASDTSGAIMGDHWTPTDYDVRTSRVTGEKKVIATQPFIRPIESYGSAPELINGGASTAEKHLFADRLRELHDRTGWFADIAGPNNVGRTGHGLQIVDTIPVFPDVQQEVAWRNGQMMGTYIDEQITCLSAVV